MKLSEDYTVTYSDNINAGTATVLLTGTGRYSGMRTETFTIEKGNQTITVKNYTNTLGDVAFKLGAKTSGNGKLTYVTSNTKVAAVNKTNGKVTLKGTQKE